MICPTACMRPQNSLWIGVVWLATYTTAAAEPGKFALLVGCTEYPNQKKVRELYGPANDVKLWADLLTDPTGFAFPKNNVTQLVGWQAELTTRPTYDNIAKGFEDLIAKAQPGSRVVILLSGHGVQVPIPETQKDPLDPTNPEPDGMDEVFLSADVKAWTEYGCENAIRDDQIGEWLDRLRDKGAHVLIVCDFCHSGTATRASSTKGEPDPDTPELTRTTNPLNLGIPAAAIAAAAARAEVAVAAAKAAGKAIPGIDKVKEKPGRGSLVAFYAAQPFEEAPEMPLPEGRPVLRDNYYGMLSFTLAETIRQRQASLSYRELGRIVASKYRAARATRPPTPFAEGDLTREVLGLADWPNRPPLFMEADKTGKLRVGAGALQRVTPGSVYAIHPLGAAAAEPLGYVKVTSDVTALNSAVIPVRREDDGAWVEAAADTAKFPALSRCEVISRNLSDLEVKVFSDRPEVMVALGKLHPERAAMVRLVATEPQAEWVLRVVSPAIAMKEYGVDKLTTDEVFLVQGTGKTHDPKRDENKPKPAVGLPRYPKVFGRYPLTDEPALVGSLELDLPKVFTWQNVWRVANAVNASENDTTHGLEVEVVKLRMAASKDGEILRDGQLKDGQDVLFRAKNGGPRDLWVSAFYLDSNLGIQVVFSSGVAAGQAVRFGQGKMSVKGNSAGREGLVVFAIPQASVNDPPNFEVIKQEPLAVADPNKGGGIRSGPTPFERLLSGAAVNRGTRALVPRVNTTPAILTQSWVLVP